MTMRAAVSSGRSDFDNSARQELRQPGRTGRRHRLDRRRAARRLDRRESGAAHRDDFYPVRRLHRRQRVAGIDRPHKGVGRHDGADVGDLHDVEQCRDPRHQILARSRRRRQHVRVALGQPGHQRRHILGQAVVIGRIVGQQHLGGAGDLGRRLGRRRQSLPATRMWMSPPNSFAAATALSVAGFSAALSCSARTRTGIRSLAPRF